MPPRWALGNLMSRFGYTSQEQATSIVKQMKDEKFPLDAIIFDLFGLEIVSKVIWEIWIG